MDKQEFIVEAKTALLKMLPEDMNISLEETKIVKVNDEELNGIMIKREGSNASPTFYLEDLYEGYRHGATIETLMRGVARGYMETLNLGEKLDKEGMEKTLTRENLVPKLVEMERNEKYLKDVPYMPVGNGFAVVLDVRAKDGRGGYYSSTVRNEMVKRFDCSEEELFKDAFENAWDREPPILCNMEESTKFVGKRRNLLLGEGIIRWRDKSVLYILTNKRGVYGASALFYPGMQEKLAEKLGEDYYAIPSSMHEFMIVGISEDVRAEVLREMLWEANRNRNIVARKEILSDRVLLFEKEKGLTSLAPLDAVMEQEGETMS